jgi:hypothetical protein
MVVEYLVQTPNCGFFKFTTVGLLGDVWVEIPGQEPYQLVWLPIVLTLPLGVLSGAIVRAVLHANLASIAESWTIAWLELTPAERTANGLPGSCTPPPA